MSYFPFFRPPLVWYDFPSHTFGRHAEDCRHLGDPYTSNSVLTSASIGLFVWTSFGFLTPKSPLSIYHNFRRLSRSLYYRPSTNILNRNPPLTTSIFRRRFSPSTDRSDITHLLLNSRSHLSKRPSSSNRDLLPLRRRPLHSHNSYEILHHP